jgi:hypothetical protein
MRFVIQHIVSSECQSKSKAWSKHSENQDVPQLAHPLDAFAPSLLAGIILQASPEDRNTEYMKSESPNCQPNKADNNPDKYEYELAQTQILLQDCNGAMSSNSLLLKSGLLKSGDFAHTRSHNWDKTRRSGA